MHELGLTRNIVAIVSEHARGRPIKRVTVAIGPQACVETEALKFCFEIATDKTVLQGAELDIVSADGDTFVIKEFEVKEAA